jgi:ribosome maturation factor RimP
MGRLDDLKEEVSKRAQLLCDELGLEVVELHLNPYNEAVNIQLIADRPNGGIEIEECSRLNRRLDDILFKELMLGATYTLEVSSPGLDRPLKDFRDFRRVIGREMHIFLHERFQGKMELIGAVKGVRDGEIILKTRDGELIVPLDKIDKGKQVIN